MTPEGRVTVTLTTEQASAWDREGIAPPLPVAAAGEQTVDQGVALMAAWCRYLGVDDYTTVIPSTDFAAGFRAGAAGVPADAKKAFDDGCRYGEMRAVKGGRVSARIGELEDQLAAAADDQAVERVAKVLADDAGWDWHEDSYVSPDPKWQPTDKAEYRRMARKALAAAAGVPVDAAPKGHSDA